MPLGPDATHMGLFLPSTSVTVCSSQFWRGHVDNLVPKGVAMGHPEAVMFELTFSPWAPPSCKEVNKTSLTSAAG